MRATATCERPTGTADVAERLLVVIGPSASGKSSIIRRLTAHGLLRVHPTWTTRPRRGDEQGGSVEHRFVTESAFAEAEDDGTFVGTTTMFNLPYRYGLPSFGISQAGPVDTIMLRAPLVPLLRAFHPRFVVYAIDASVDATNDRLAARGLRPAELHERQRDNRLERELAMSIAQRVFDSSGGTPRDLRRVCGEVELAMASDFVQGGPTCQ